MGFADYLSRQPNSQPTGENVDKNHVINTIEAIHYTLHTTHRKSTNQIARKRRTLDDVTNHSNQSETKHSAFRHLYAIKRLPSLTFNNTQLNQNYINSNSIITNHLYKSDSEPDLDIQFQKAMDEEDSSDQSTLQNIQKKAIKRKNISPTKITPDKLMVTFGDKITTITNTRKQVARKTFARKTLEPRGTLKPLWKIIPDGTISNYSPTTITLDTNTRKNTVIRKKRIGSRKRN